jgi:hypothetical protein
LKFQRKDHFFCQHTTIPAVISPVAELGFESSLGCSNALVFEKTAGHFFERVFGVSHYVGRSNNDSGF